MQREQPGLYGGQPLGQLADLGGEAGEASELRTPGGPGRLVLG
jgi:hypothetical protein